MLPDDTYQAAVDRVMRTVALAGAKEFEDDLALLLIDLKYARLQVNELQNKLEVSETKVAYLHEVGKEQEEKYNNTLRLNGELRKALEKVDAMRKRLPDPDFNEQKNTAAGIAEIIQHALAEKRTRDVAQEIKDFDAKYFPGEKCNYCGDVGWIHLIAGGEQKRVRCPKCGEK